MKKTERPQRAGEILETFFRRNNIAGGEEHVAFYRNWEEIVGFDLATHTSVTDIRNTALVVEVDHPAWMQMVQLRQKQILATVQRRFPKLGVKSLNLRLVERLGTPVVPPPAPSREDPPPRAVARTQKSAAADEPSATDRGETPETPEKPEGDRLRTALDRLGRAISEREDR